MTQTADPSFGTDYAVAPAVTSLTQPVSKVLLVGNSLMFYNCGVSSMLQGLAKAAGRKLQVTMVGIGGASLYWHDVKSYLRPNGLRSYRITEENKFEFIEYPNGKVFDAVIMVDSTQGPIHPELSRLFDKYAKKHCEDIRATGADPLLMVSWGYSDRPGMTRALADSIISTANRCGSAVTPVGIAFERAMRERPGLELIRSDRRHPTVAGTLLEAAVFYASLFAESPEEAPYTGRYDDLQVDADTARFIRRTAWRTVRDFCRW